MIKRKSIPLFVVAISMMVVSGCSRKTSTVTLNEINEVVSPSVKCRQMLIPEKSQGDMNIDMPGPSPMSSMKEEIMIIEDSIIFFDFDKYTLNQWSFETLDRLAAFLKTNPTIRIQIIGNCDERGTVEYNLALGERRARSAMNYIASLGIEKGRISILSFGKEKPIDPGHNNEAWAKNRNDRFVVLTEQQMN